MFNTETNSPDFPTLVLPKTTTLIFGTTAVVIPPFFLNSSSSNRRWTYLCRYLLTNHYRASGSKDHKIRQSNGADKRDGKAESRWQKGGKNCPGRAGVKAWRNDVRVAPPRDAEWEMKNGNHFRVRRRWRLPVEVYRMRMLPESRRPGMDRKVTKGGHGLGTRYSFRSRAGTGRTVANWSFFLASDECGWFMGTEFLAHDDLFWSYCSVINNLLERLFTYKFIYKVLNYLRVIIDIHFTWKK